MKTLNKVVLWQGLFVSDSEWALNKKTLAGAFMSANSSYLDKLLKFSVQRHESQLDTQIRVLLF